MHSSALRRRRPLCAAFVAASALVGFAPAARADAPASPVTAQLFWTRGRGAELCPDDAALRAAVETHLGRPVFDATSPLRVDATVAAGDPALEGVNAPLWTAQISVHRGDGTLVGERRLTADDAGCAPLVRAVALSVAITLDTDAALLESEAPAAQTPTAAQTPAAAQTPPAAALTPPWGTASASARAARARRRAMPWLAPEAPPSERRGWDVAVGLRIAEAFGSAIAPSTGLGALVELTPPSGPGIAATVWHYPQMGGASSGASGTAQLGALGGALALCPVLFRVGALSAAACAGFFIETVQVHNPTGTTTSVGTNGGGQAGGRLRWDFGAAFTELSVDGTVPFFGNGPVVEGGDGGNPNGPEWQSATLRTALTVGAHFR